MRRTTYYSNRTALPLTRAVQFPFTLSVRVDDSQAASFSYTLETWFRLNAWANAPGPFGSSGSESAQMLFLASGPQGDSFLVRLNNNGAGLGAIEFFSYAGGVLYSAALVPVGEWVHLRCTYDNTTFEGIIYLNNHVVARGSFAAAQYSISALNLGHIESNRSSNNMNGQMDETRLWPYVRSAVQNQASWQLPNKELPDLTAAQAAWSYEDPIPSSGSVWSGFADGSGHGLALRSSSNGYEGSQPVSTVPFQATSAAWDPTLLGSALAAWYAPDSVILSPANRVVQWRDKTGQHGDSELRTDAQAPLLFNGSIYYTANRYGSEHQTIDISFQQLTLPQPFSIVVRAKIDGNEAPPYATDYLFDGYDNTRTLITINGGGNNDEQFYFGVASGGMYPVTIPRTIWQGQWHTYALVANGASSACYMDGELVAAQDIGMAGLNGLRFGARFSYDNGLNGELPEAVICNTALSAAQIVQIHSYLAAKFSD